MATYCLFAANYSRRLNVEKFIAASLADVVKLYQNWFVNQIAGDIRAFDLLIESDGKIIKITNKSYINPRVFEWSIDDDECLARLRYKLNDWCEVDDCGITRIEIVEFKA